MAVAGSIVVNLIANTRSFQQGLRRSKMSVEDVRRSVMGQSKAIRNVSKEMSGMFVTAVGASVLAIGKLIQKNNELADSYVITGDRAVKFARSLNIAIADMQGLEYAAEQMGSSGESLTRSLTRMIANIGDVAKGIGEAKDSFEALGLNANELINLSADKSFIKIADAIKKVENKTLAASYAYEIFGRKGIELINTLNLGSEGISKFKKEAEDLGAIMSESVSENIAEAKGEIDKFTAAQRGFEQSKGGASLFSPRPIRSFKEWWYTKGPTRKYYDMLNNDSDASWKAEMKAAQATKERADQLRNLAEKAQMAADAQKRLNAAAKLKKQESGMQYFYDMLGDLRDQVAGVDDLTRSLNKMSATLNLSSEQYNKMKKVIEEINQLQGILDAREKDKKDKKDILKNDSFSFNPRAREIDTSRISIAGLAMSGQTYDYDKRQVDILGEIARNTRKSANQEILN